MFKKLEHTQYPPKKPLMVWDGNCGFCAYWVTRWQKITGPFIDYQPYQEAAEDFPDIERKHFQEASRLIDTEGRIYSGPRSAYRSFTYGRSNWSFLDRWYANKSWFQQLSDRLYQWVAKNRSTLFKITKACFGRDPEQVRPFWVIYVAVLAYFLYLLF